MMLLQLRTIHFPFLLHRSLPGDCLTMTQLGKMNIYQKAQQLPAAQDLLAKGNCDCILADSRMQW